MPLGPSVGSQIPCPWRCLLAGSLVGNGDRSPRMALVRPAEGWFTLSSSIFSCCFLFSSPMSVLEQGRHWGPLVLMFQDPISHGTGRSCSAPGSVSQGVAQQCLTSSSTTPNPLILGLEESLTQAQTPSPWVQVSLVPVKPLCDQRDIMSHSVPQFPHLQRSLLSCLQGPSKLQSPVQYWHSKNT